MIDDLLSHCRTDRASRFIHDKSGRDRINSNGQRGSEKPDVRKTRVSETNRCGKARIFVYCRIF